MSSRLHDLAEDVKNYLNGLTLSKAFTSEIVYYPRYDVKDLASLKVIVIPFSFVGNAIARDTIHRGMDIDIWVAQRIDVDSVSVIDEYVYLIEEIVDSMKNQLFTSSGYDYCWESSNVIAIPDVNVLDEWRVFSTVIANTFAARA